MNDMMLINPQASRIRPIRRRVGAATISRHRTSVCVDSGKRRYRDRHQATDALNSVRRQRSQDLVYAGETRRFETRLYTCDSCKGFHLTSLAEWVVRSPAGVSEAGLGSVTRLAALRAIAMVSGLEPRTTGVAA